MAADPNFALVVAYKLLLKHASNDVLAALNNVLSFSDIVPAANKGYGFAITNRLIISNGEPVQKYELCVALTAEVN